MRQINFWPVLGLFLTVFSAINSGQAQEIIRIDHGQLLNINGHTVEYQSCAGLSYMIPNRTSEEFDSFVNAGKAGRLPGIVIDGLGNADSQWYYEDKDDDGWGTEYRQCLGGPSGDYTATQSGDCDDVDAHAYPGGTELWCNGIDENCDGQDGIAGATDFAYRQRQCTLLSDYLAAPIKNPEEEYCGNRAVFAVVALKANGGPSEDRELHLQNAMDWVEWITDQDWTGNDWPDGSPPCYFQLDSFLRLVLDTEIFNQFTQSTQESLLDALWDFVNERSLYAYPASGDTWNINGSENHDIVKEASVFMAVQALAKSMNPVYPSSRLLHDGKSLNDHYSVWTSFYKLYFKERAMRGLLLEIASPTYSRYTLPYVYLIADFAYSSILKDQARKFLDLYWSDVAQDYIPEIGVRGGAQTRAYKDKILTYGDWEGCQPFYYLFNWFGNPEKDFPTMGAVTSAYQPPEVVSSIALANKPPYLFRSQRPGLGYSECANDYYCIRFETNGSNISRTSWVAAEYVLGGLASDPSIQEYVALFTQNQMAGAMFSTHHNARLLFVGLAAGSGGYLGGGKTAYREIVTAVSNNAMIAQRDPNHVDNEGIRFYFSYDGDVWNNSTARVADEEGSTIDGWIFTRSGDAYAAVRIASGGYQRYTYGPGKCLRLAQPDSPVAIQMGRKADYGSLEAFQSAVESNFWSFDGSKLTYVSEAGDTFEIENGFATVNGQTTWSPAKTYDSPYISADYPSPVVQISYPGMPTLALDFNY